MFSRGVATRAENVSIAAPRRRSLAAILVLAAFAIAGWFYYFTVESTGTLHRRGVNFDYYNLLVEGFRSGHLYLPISPRPELMALPDPYEPSANDKLRLGDASYYGGHYYIYFGVTPAVVLMLPYTLLTGQPMAQSGAVLIFCFVGVMAASAVWLSVRRRYFGNSAFWVAPLGVLVIGFGTHVLALARRPSVWELPIAAGFCFTMLALLATYRAVHGRRPVLAMSLAALCLGLATGARPTALLTGGMLVIALWHLARTRESGVWKRATLAALLVLATIGAALAWYNYARFGAIFEFGEHYQLTGLNERHAHHFSPRFIAYNLRVYFTWPTRWTDDFPFIASRPVPPWPTGYFSGEELYCLAAWTPVLWFIVFAAVVWSRGTRGLDAGFRVVVGTIAAVLLPLLLVMLCFFYAAERYMVDFVPTMVLLALCGVLVVERACASPRSRRIVRSVLAVAGVVTVIAGTLASFDYHGRSMKKTDPAAWHKLAAAAEPPVQALARWLHLQSP